MKYTYAEFLAILDWEFQQEKQGGDSAQADKFRFLPHTQALRVINETIRELVTISPDQYEREYTYVVVTKHEDEILNHLELPEFIIKVMAYWADDEWKILGDSSDLDSEITSIDSNTIYSSTGWSRGDTIKLKIVAFPHLVIETGATVDINVTIGDNYFTFDYGDFPVDSFPEGSLILFGGEADRYKIERKSHQALIMYLNRAVVGSSYPTINSEPSTYIPLKDPYIRLLILEIKRKVYSRKGKALANFEYSELMSLKQQWREETSPVQHKARISFEGYGLGR